MALGRVLVDMSLLEEARRSFLFAASIRHNQVGGRVPGTAECITTPPPPRPPSHAHPRHAHCTLPSLPPSCILQHIAHYWLGVVAAKRGLFDEAKDALQNALFYNPSYFPAMLNLGGLLIVQGYLEQGLYAWHALAAQFVQSLLSHAAVGCCCCLVWLLLHLCPVTTTRQLWRGWSPKM